MDENQTLARAAFREYLGQTYGRDKASLIMNIADLESNFRPGATNSTSSAAGLTQITSGHWDTLAESVRGKLRRGEMSADQLPAGMTPNNIGDFNRHKFDEISSAFMTSENIDYLGQRFVVRANKQRSALGKPPVANMSELTGGNYALEAFMIAGGHKDGWGVHTKGKLAGTGFGAAIKGGEIDMDSLMTSYEQNRQTNERAGEPITDGMGHGLSYAMFASDNVMETAGGPKLQLTPKQIKTGLSLKAPNVRVDNRLAAPWMDRAQQIDPGFEPTDEELAQWLPRLDLADPNARVGANDIISTNVLPELNNEALPRVSPVVPVAVEESRQVSEDPSVAARAASRLTQKVQRTAESALGAGLDFLISDAGAAEPSGPTNPPPNATPAQQPDPAPRQDPATFQPLNNLQEAFAQRSAEQGDLTGGALSSIEQFGQPSIGGNSLQSIEQFGQPAPLVGTTLDSINNITPQSDLGAGLDNIATFGDQQLQDEQLRDQITFRAEQRRLEDIVNTFNSGRRAGSAELEGQVPGAAAQLRANDLQDLAIGAVPNINLQSQPQQGFQQPSLADYAVPGNPNFNVGSVAPSNKQLQRVVDQGRRTDQDYQFAAAADLLAEQDRGSINDFINRARGTNLEEQANDRAIQGAQLGLDAIYNGQLNYQNLPELQALYSKQDQFATGLAGLMINNSRSR